MEDTEQGGEVATGTREDLPECFALVLDGQGGAMSMAFESVPHWKREDGPLWVHLAVELGDERLKELLGSSTVLPDTARALLLERVSRVRAEVVPPDGVVLQLRQSGSPSSKISPARDLRIWLTPRRCLTLSDSQHDGIKDLRSRLARRMGPRSVEELLHDATMGSIARAMIQVSDLDDKLTELEVDVEKRRGDVRDRLRVLRQTLIEQRRFATLSRDAILRFGALEISWLKDQKVVLQEMSQRMESVLKELGSLQDRARILHEEVQSREDARTQHTLYILTIISGVFLPLSFITGLLGVNVGGIPGTQWRGSFLLLCLALVALAAAEWQALRRRELV